MTVVITELPGSPKGQFTESGVYQFTRMVRTTWADIDAYAQQLQPATGIIGDEIIIYPGESFPGFPNFKVKSFEFEPFFGSNDRIVTQADDSTSTPPDYEYAKWTIHYAIPPSPQTAEEATNKDPVPFLEHQITSGGQYLTLGTKDGADVDWNWVAKVDGNDTIIEAIEADSERIAAMLGTTQHTVHWPRIKTPNWYWLESLKGCVNAYPFTLRGHQYPSESLLYMGYDAHETVMTDGNQAFNMTIKFEGKRVINQSWVAPSSASATFYGTTVDSYGGHNHFWNKTAKAWLRVTKSGTDPSVGGPYPLADFTYLFKAGT